MRARKKRKSRGSPQEKRRGRAVKQGRRAGGRPAGEGRPPDVVTALARAARARGMGGRPFFDPGRPVAAARAPGRLDVLGGIGDYSGCRVLQWPIAAAAVAMAQASDDGLIIVLSRELQDRGVAGEPEVHVDVSCVAPFRDYAEFCSRLPTWPGAAWTAYVLGAFAVLMAEKGARF